MSLTGDTRPPSDPLSGLTEKLFAHFRASDSAITYQNLPWTAVIFGITGSMSPTEVLTLSREPRQEDGVDSFYAWMASEQETIYHVGAPTVLIRPDDCTYVIRYTRTGQMVLAARQINERWMLLVCGEPRWVDKTAQSFKPFAPQGPQQSDDALNMGWETLRRAGLVP